MDPTSTSHVAPVCVMSDCCNIVLLTHSSCVCCFACTISWWTDDIWNVTLCYITHDMHSNFVAHEVGKGSQNNKGHYAIPRGSWRRSYSLKNHHHCGPCTLSHTHAHAYKNTYINTHIVTSLGAMLFPCQIILILVRVFFSFEQMNKRYSWNVVLYYRTRHPRLVLFVWQEYRTGKHFGVTKD